MKFIDILSIVGLGAIWGASFLFMRVASPEMGPIALVAIRMISAALFLIPIFFIAKNRTSIQQNIGWLLILALLNNVVPFALLAFSSTRLEAGFTSLLNATTPVWTALVGFAFFADRVSKQQMFGLIIAFFGVFVLSANRMSFTQGGPGWAILAGLVATLCYGFSLHIVKNHLAQVPPLAITAGTVTISALILIIPGAIYWPTQELSQYAWISAVLLGVLCTAIAFLILFPLVKRVGPTSTATITYLIPVFAISWGVILLGEAVSVQMLLGMLITFLGTGFVLNLVPANRWAQKRVS